LDRRRAGARRGGARAASGGLDRRGGGERAGCRRVAPAPQLLVAGCRRDLPRLPSRHHAFAGGRRPLDRRARGRDRSHRSAVGRVVAGRELPAAGWIGAVAGNAPDVAELLLRPNSWSPDAGVTYLVFHRGITHSLVGAALEIAVLAGVIGLIARQWGGARDE